MCVPNASQRNRSQAITLDPSQLGGIPGVLSQRLLGGTGFALPDYAAARSQPTNEYVQVPPPTKQRAKRRRKPQKPGKTAKMNDRHFVVHNYHDHAQDEVTEVVQAEEETERRRGGVSVAFPIKLHAVLDQVEADGLGHIISWQPHGRCFVIHKPKEFVDHVMPQYFRQTKLTSFQRQLNLYGFSRLTRGPDAGGYYHELFLRGKTFLCKKMTRTKVKGTRFKAASSPDQEPDFYKMKPVVISPHPSSDEEMSHDSGAPQPAAASSIDPLPIQYASVPSMPLPYQFTGFVAAPQQQPAMPLFNQVVAAQPPPAPQEDADYVLDEAVDELFLNGGMDDNLADFLNDWDPNVSLDANADDTQLGFLLDRLLEED